MTKQRLIVLFIALCLTSSLGVSTPIRRVRSNTLKEVPPNQSFLEENDHKQLVQNDATSQFLQENANVNQVNQMEQRQIPETVQPIQYLQPVQPAQPVQSALIQSSAEVEWVQNEVTLTPKFPDFAGQSYDIFTGNPLDKRGDPGFTAKQIFRMSYDSLSVTPDNIFYTPREVSLTKMPSCSLATSSKVITGMKSYHNTLSVAAEISGGYSGLFASASFTASAEYSEMEQSIQRSQQVSVLTQLNCDLYEVSLGIKELSPAFLQDVEDARETGDWNGFLTEWGTHYAFNVQLGASAISRTMISRTDAETLQSKGINVAAAFGAKAWGFNVAASVNVGSSSATASATSSVKSETTEYYIGSGRPQNGDMQKWASNIQESAYPVPTTFKLKFIGDLFIPRLFGTKYEPATLEKMRNDFAQAATSKAAKYKNVPYFDVGLNKKNMQSQSIVIGSPGMDAVNNLIYTPTRVTKIEWYSPPSKKEAVFTIGLRTAAGLFYCIGGFCGSMTNSHVLAEGVYLSRMRITLDKRQIVSYMIAYLSDGSILEIGKTVYSDQSEFFTYDLEIPQSLVAIRGRSIGNEIASLQFISSIVAYEKKPVLHATPWYGLPTVVKHTFYEYPQVLTPEGRLVSIRATYSSTEGITSIQCTFSSEDGVITNVYGVSRGNATETVNIQGNVKGIQIWTDNTNGVQGFKLDIDDRPNPVIFGLTQGTINEILVPDDGRLVGVYGYYNDKIVSGLGFKFALFSEDPNQDDK